MTKNVNNTFLNYYNDNYDNLVNNLFLHQPNSPFSNPLNSKVDKDRNRIIEGINTQSKEIYKQTNTKQIISAVKRKEKKQISELIQIYLFNLDEETKKANQLSNITVNSLGEDERIRLLNKIYKIYHQSKRSNNRAYYGKDNKDTNDDTGYFNYGKFSKDKLEEDYLNEFASCFNSEVNIIKNFKSGEILKTLYKGKFDRYLNNIETELKKFLKELEQKEAGALQQENYEQAALYNFYLDYFSGRGLSLIAELKKTKGNNSSRKSLETIFEETKKDFILTGDTTFNNRINTAKLQKRHYDFKDIKGSFEAVITKASKGGFAAEYIKNAINLNLKFGQKEIVSKVTGGIKSIRGVDQKVDIKMGINTTVKELDKSTVISKNKITKDNSDIINFSVKNYQPDSDVSVHTGGSLETVLDFLNTYKPPTAQVSFNEYEKILNSNEFKYILLNESWTLKRNDSKIIEALKNSLNDLGAIFTLTPFLITKDNNLIDETVDFLLINDTIIPGSYILDAANRVQSQEARFRTTITFPTELSDGKYETTTDAKGKKHKHLVGSSGKSEKYKDNLYEIEYLKERKSNSEGYLNNYKFSLHLVKSFRQEIEKIVSGIK